MVKTENVWSYQGQPNSFWTERCAQFKWFSDSIANVAIHDFDCANTYYIVCEKV